MSGDGPKSVWGGSWGCGAVANQKPCSEGGNPQEAASEGYDPVEAGGKGRLSGEILLGVGWTGDGDTLGLVGWSVDRDSPATFGLDAGGELMTVAPLAGAAISLGADGQTLAAVGLRADGGSMAGEPLAGAGFGRANNRGTGSEVNRVADREPPAGVGWTINWGAGTGSGRTAD